MKWCLSFDFEGIPKPISFGQHCTFIGSCFSQEILELGQQSGMNFHPSGFGTLFHPLAILNVLDRAMTFNFDKLEESFIEENGQFFTYEAGKLLSAGSKTELRDKLISLFEELHESIKKSDFLFITFGTAWGYVLNANNKFVANCHKQDSRSFTKELSVFDELERQMSSLFQRLKKFNPSIQIITTVSPVRHKKDGLIENNRSKARLLMLCEHLEKTEGTFYFPAYEIVLDQLRDYRFYKEDLVHPNTQAVQEVWTVFCEKLLNPKEETLRNKVFKVKGMEKHKSISSSSDAIFIEKKIALSALNPKIFW
jgi:hypothetical protein